MRRSGQCACGKLGFEVRSEAKFVAACNCTACQKRTGSAFGIGTFFAADDVTIRGEYNTYERTSDSGRKVFHRFCATCGTTVAWTAEAAPGKIILAGGTFDDQSWIKPGVIAWTSCAQQWVIFPGDIKSFDEKPKK